jgi:hypothetical protein
MILRTGLMGISPGSNEVSGTYFTNEMKNSKKNHAASIE